jgi:pimeloyl-ACP methyl ester carboxylesterase
MNKRFFTNLTDEDWRKMARQLFTEVGGRPAPSYDNKISNALSEIDITQKLPEMWPQFEALKHIPVMVLRGENSDLLSPKTVEEMAQRHPHLTAVTIHAQGHAPLLTDRFSMGIIADFLRETDPDATLSAGAERNGRKQLPSLGPAS